MMIKHSKNPVDLRMVSGILDYRQTHRRMRKDDVGLRPTSPPRNIP